MNAIKINNTKTIQEIPQKDILKGQKILAAVYMVTNHVPEHDAIRQTLRKTTAEFVCATSHEATEILHRLEILIGGAVFAGMVSEKNSSVILYEMKRWAQGDLSTPMTTAVEELFAKEGEGTPLHHQIKDIKKTSKNVLFNSPQPRISALSNTAIKEKSFMQKSLRHDTILSFINTRKSAVIKDIVSLFPDVSEKTIQRELSTLINEGKITKRGSKRWSMYMAVNSLL